MHKLDRLWKMCMYFFARVVHATKVTSCKKSNDDNAPHCTKGLNKINVSGNCLSCAISAHTFRSQNQVKSQKSNENDTFRGHGKESKKNKRKYVN